MAGAIKTVHSLLMTSVLWNLLLASISHGCIATALRNPGEIWPQGNMERERAGSDAGGVLQGAS